jgi:SAM-dependent methyltransferase
MDCDDEASTWDTDPVKRKRAFAAAAAIRRRVPLPPARRALEYGCGTGLSSFALQADLGELTLADSSPGMLAVLGGLQCAIGCKRRPTRVGETIRCFW